MAEHSAVNRRVVGSSPTSGAKESITYSGPADALKFRPATPILSTGAVQPSSTAAVHEFTAFRTLLLNRLAIHVTACRNAGMPQYALSVLQRYMFLHIRTRHPSHHLKVTR